MDDLVQAVLMTAAIPGFLVGVLASIRSGIAMTLLGALVGTIGGIAGGFGLPGLSNAFGVAIPDGPLTVVAGSVLGGVVLLLLTSGLRKPASA